MRKKICLASTGAIFLATAPAFAGNWSSADSVEWPTTTTGEVFTSTITGVPALISLDQVNINLSHTWAGDLTILLDTPAGTINITTLGDAAGFNANTDLGQVAGSGALSNVAPYSFVESGGASWVGSTGPSFLPGPGPFNAETWTGGAVGAGSYTLHVFDTAGGDGGSVGGWSIDGTVPAPGAIALLGAAGLISRRRRRA
jgi:hypothetical protein